jgi:hypothetical protein
MLRPCALYGIIMPAGPFLTWADVPKVAERQVENILLAGVLVGNKILSTMQIIHVKKDAILKADV